MRLTIPKKTVKKKKGGVTPKTANTFFVTSMSALVRNGQGEAHQKTFSIITTRHQWKIKKQLKPASAVSDLPKKIPLLTISKVASTGKGICIKHLRVPSAAKKQILFLSVTVP
jgi:hypothetical protein